MSYILDALKKSDRERQQEETPAHLQPLHGTPPSFKGMSIARRRRWLWLIFPGLLICAGLLKGFDWNRQGIEEQPSPPMMPTVPETGKSLDPMTILGEKFDDWYRHVPKKDLSSPSPGSPQPDEAKRQAVVPASSPVVIASTANYSKKISEPEKIKRDREREKKVLSPQSEATVIRRPHLFSPAKPEKPDNALPYLQDLPPQIQAEIPKLQFAGHAYALAPAQRLIIVNGTIRREGDQLDDVTRLAEITLEGVIIDRKGVRFQVKCD